MNWKLFLENIKIAIMKRPLAKTSAIISDRSTKNSVVENYDLDLILLKQKLIFQKVV